MVVKGASWRSHKQSKVHSLRTHSAGWPGESHEAGVGGVASLVLAGIPPPQPSAAIPMDHETLRTDQISVDDGFDLDEPYRGTDGSVIQFSAGLMYPSAEETVRREMDQLTEELEAWGSGLAGEDFGGEVDGTGGQSEGMLIDTSHLPNAYHGMTSEHGDLQLIQEIGRSLLSVNTSHDLFPYLSRTVQYFPITLFWGGSHEQ